MIIFSPVSYDKINLNPIISIYFYLFTLKAKPGGIKKKVIRVLRSKKRNYGWLGPTLGANTPKSRERFQLMGVTWHKKIMGVTWHKNHVCDGA